LKNYLLILFPVLVLCFGACKKDAPDLTGLTVKDGVAIPAGNGPGSNNGNIINNSYLPTTTGSSWTYQSDITGTTQRSEAHITGVITPINGQNYFELKGNSNGQESVSYYYVKDKKYKIRSTSIEQKATVEFFLLDDNLLVGDEWTGTMTADGSVNGIPGRTKHKIIESGITKTVLNKTYRNVIHTQMTVQYNLFGNGFEDFGDYDFYLAKGIGLIQTDASFQGFASSTYLAAYTIK